MDAHNWILWEGRVKRMTGLRPTYIHKRTKWAHNENWAQRQTDRQTTDEMNI